MITQHLSLVTPGVNTDTFGERSFSNAGPSFGNKTKKFRSVLLMYHYYCYYYHPGILNMRALKRV